MPPESVTLCGQKNKHTLFKQGMVKVSAVDLPELNGRDSIKLLSRNPKASYGICHEVQPGLVQCRTGICNIQVQEV